MKKVGDKHGLEMVMKIGWDTEKYRTPEEAADAYLAVDPNNVILEVNEDHLVVARERII